MLLLAEEADCPAGDAHSSASPSREGAGAAADSGGRSPGTSGGRRPPHTHGPQPRQASAGDQDCHADHLLSAADLLTSVSPGSAGRARAERPGLQGRTAPACAMTPAPCWLVPPGTAHRSAGTPLRWCRALPEPGPDRPRGKPDRRVADNARSNASQDADRAQGGWDVLGVRPRHAMGDSYADTASYAPPMGRCHAWMRPLSRRRPGRWCTGRVIAVHTLRERHRSGHFHAARSRLVRRVGPHPEPATASPGAPVKCSARPRRRRHSIAGFTDCGTTHGAMTSSLCAAGPGRLFAAEEGEHGSERRSVHHHHHPCGTQVRLLSTGQRLGHHDRPSVTSVR